MPIIKPESLQVMSMDLAPIWLPLGVVTQTILGKSVSRYRGL